MEHSSSRNLSTAPSSSLDPYKAYDNLQAIPSNVQREDSTSNLELSNIHLASKTIEVSQKIFVQPTVSSDIVDRPSYCPQNRVEPACYFQHVEGANRNFNDIMPSAVGGNSLGPNVLLEEQSNVVSAQKNIRTGPEYGIGGTKNDVKSNDHNVRHPSLSSSAGSLLLDLKGQSSKNGVTQEPDKLDDSIASVVTKKLWDGYLHLNSSVKLPTIAYFKSGEKMPGINWSESIEVKGKVRLEAFEKYIQELPRSRTRGLMVMSLSLRGGSSFKSGRVGIKEVANKLIQGKRVGLAQLSPGVDLYVCPISDPIVSVLAKHGFFKDMKAVKDEHDSLIGCVVWRKTSLDPNTKRVDEKNGEKPLTSPSGFNSDLQFPPSSSSSARSGDATQPKTTVANHNIGSSNIQSASSSLSSAATTSVSSSLISLPLDRKQDALPPGDLTSIHGIVKQLSEIESSIFQSLGLANCGGNLELLKAILPSSLSPHKPSEDDLPEYDFNSAAARPSASRTSMEADEITNQNPQDEEFRRVNMPSSSGRIYFDSQTNIPSGRMATVHKRKAHQLENVWSNSSEKAGVSHSKPKTVFNDDDMPEWNPPDSTIAFKPLSDASVGPVPGTISDRKLSSSSLSSSSNHPPLLVTPPSLQFPPKQLPAESSQPTGFMTPSLSRPPRPHDNAYVLVSPRYSSSARSDHGSRDHSKPYSSNSEGSVHHKR